MYYLVSYPDLDRWSVNKNIMRGMKYEHNTALIAESMKYGIYYVYDCDDELTLIGSVSEIAEFLLLVVMPFEFRLCCVND